MVISCLKATIFEKHKSMLFSERERKWSIFLGDEIGVWGGDGKKTLKNGGFLILYVADSCREAGKNGGFLFDQ